MAMTVKVAKAPKKPVEIVRVIDVSDVQSQRTAIAQVTGLLRQKEVLAADKITLVFKDVSFPVGKIVKDDQHLWQTRTPDSMADEIGTKADTIQKVAFYCWSNRVEVTKGTVEEQNNG